MGSSLDLIIHEHRRLSPVSAPVPFAPVSWMSWMVSRIWHARAVLSRCFCRLRLVSNWSSVRFDSFLGHRHFVLFGRPFPRPSALRTLSTASLACLITWNLSIFWRRWGAIGGRPRRIPGSCRTSCTGHASSGHDASGQWNREPIRKPIAMCGSRLPFVPSRNSTPDTIHGSGNCKAKVNSEVVSIPPNYPNALTSDHPSPTPNSEKP